jgi:hypothetical protein
MLNDKTATYPAVLLQDSSGSISLANKSTTLTYRMFIVDLAHVSADAKANEQDVHSDMVSVAMDILAQLNRPEYQDWKISQSNSLKLVVEEGGDMFAGCSIDFSVSILFNQNVCAVPTNLPSYGSDSENGHGNQDSDAGVTYSAIAGQTLSGNRVVYIENDKAFYYDPSNTSLYGRVLGITTNAASVNQPVEVQLIGVMNWSSIPLVAGSLYYAGVSGQLTTNPAGLTVLQRVGHAIATNKLKINFDINILTI